MKSNESFNWIWRHAFYKLYYQEQNNVYIIVLIIRTEAMTRVKDGQNCALTEPNDKQKPLKNKKNRWTW